MNVGAVLGVSRVSLSLVGFIVATIASAGCDKGGGSSGSGSGAGANNEAVPAPRPTPPRDAGPPADRTIVRRVITFYRWQSSEPGNASTGGEPIEHGLSKLHLVIEMHRAPNNEGWATITALPGTVRIVENPRMAATNATTDWHVPQDVHTEYSMEQFGGEFRGDEPLRVLLSSAPNERIDVPVNPTPTPVRIPASTRFAATSMAPVGQYDALLVFLAPMTNRRGGRYLLEALDMLPQPGGFPANGVIAHAPTATEIERYAHWMRNRNGIGHTDPPIPLSPIDR